jgi:hypothetical protein
MTDLEGLVISSDIGKIASRIHKLRQRTCEDVIQIGRLLVEAKAKLGHGLWGEWLRHEFTWSQDTAERFISVAVVFGKAKSAMLRNIDVSSLYELARPSTPQAARDTVTGLIADKMPPSLDDVRRIIRDEKAVDVEPEPEKEKPPSVRQAAIAEQFRVAIESLLSLSTKPAGIFAGAVPAADLDMLAIFLQQIAKAASKAA